MTVKSLSWADAGLPLSEGVRMWRNSLGKGIYVFSLGHVNWISVENSISKKRSWLEIYNEKSSTCRWFAMDLIVCSPNSYLKPYPQCDYIWDSLLRGKVKWSHMGIYRYIFLFYIFLFVSNCFLLIYLGLGVRWLPTLVATVQLSYKSISFSQYFSQVILYIALS